jgi:hypothetical protein
METGRGRRRILKRVDLTGADASLMCLPAIRYLTTRVPFMVWWSVHR